MLVDSRNNDEIHLGLDLDEGTSFPTPIFLILAKQLAYQRFYLARAGTLFSTAESALVFPFAFRCRFAAEAFAPPFDVPERIEIQIERDLVDSAEDPSRELLRQRHV